MKSEGAQWNAEEGGGVGSVTYRIWPDPTIIFYPIPKGNEGDRWHGDTYYEES